MYWRPPANARAPELPLRRLSTFTRSLHVMEVEVREWVETKLGLSLQGDDLQEALKSGVVLCQLANVIQRGCCPAPSLANTPFKHMDNISNYLSACTNRLGVPVHDSFQTVDLYEKSNLGAVLVQLQSLRRIAEQGVKHPTRSDVRPDVHSLGRGGEMTFIGGRAMQGQVHAGAAFDTARPGATTTSPRLGCDWELVGTERPVSGTEIDNWDLGAALLRKFKLGQPLEFDEHQLRAFRLNGVPADGFVQAGHTAKYFRIRTADGGAPSEGAAAKPAESAADFAVVHSGYLIKQPRHGHLLSSARRRFFELGERHGERALVWSEDESRRVRKGRLELAGATVERRSSAEGGSALVVSCSGGSETLVLHGEVAELDAWEGAIRAQAEAVARTR